MGGARMTGLRRPFNCLSKRSRSRGLKLTKLDSEPKLEEIRRLQKCWSRMLADYSEYYGSSFVWQG